MRESQFLPTLVLFKVRGFTIWDFAFLLQPLHCIYSIQNLTRTLLETARIQSCMSIAQVLMQNSNIWFFQVPRTGPANVTILNITKHSALVKWTEIPAEDRLGFLQGYRISYTDSSRKKSPGKSPLPEQSSSSGS